jgi:hypothetical protein
VELWHQMGGRIVDAFEQGAVTFRVSRPPDPHLLPQVKLMAAPYRTVPDGRMRSLTCQGLHRTERRNALGWDSRRQ